MDGHPDLYPTQMHDVTTKLGNNIMSRPFTKHETVFVIEFIFVFVLVFVYTVNRLVKRQVDILCRTGPITSDVFQITLGRFLRIADG